LVAGGPVALVGVALGGATGGGLAILGLTILPLLLQDAWRFAFFASGDGRSAFINDLVWAIMLVPAVVWANGQSGLDAWIVAWAVAGGTGGLFGIWQARLWPRPMRTLAWLREHRDIAPQLVAENVVQMGTSYVTLLAITFTASLRAIAALRAAQVLMNALNVATSGVMLFAVPEAVTIARTSMSQLWRYCVLIGGGLLVLSLAWGMVLMLLPNELGRALLGDTWLSASAVLLPVALYSAGVGSRYGPLVGLRALALAGRSLRARVASSLLQVAGGISGSYIADASGAAWGMAVTSVMGTVFWWGLLASAVKGTEGTPGVSQARVPAQPYRDSTA
jgi:hypothetical protein